MSALPTVRPVVIVGTKVSRQPLGEGGRHRGAHAVGEIACARRRPAYERVRADDERGTNPGDTLRFLMNEYGPCLILIDEWVAYARQLHEAADLPGGSFETQFTFAQALTEAARATKDSLMVMSLPASDTAVSPHAQADDAEVGGERGRAALVRLRNVIGRMESSWRPASAEEGFEIVRRRLFEPLIDKEQFTARDVVARAFYDLYRTQAGEFPPECRDADYEKRLRAAYPIHPEVFDRLYTDWSTLINFQRTRGVLRLMAAVIHSLWESGDRNPLILPATIPIDDERVRSELTRYLSDNWTPVIEKDVDGPNAFPLRLDGDVPALGKYHAARRVARTIYLGSAPTQSAANRGIGDRHVRLGCVMPGEAPAVFGDALRRLSAEATYLYQDAARYWYDTQPSVTKLAEDYAEQYTRDQDAVVGELDRRLRGNLARRGEFHAVHPLTGVGADVQVPDEPDARLVVLGAGHPYSREGDSPAEQAAKRIWEYRGNTPRLYRNALVFLAVDKVRLQDLDEALRRYLAWRKILDDKDTLDLTPHQVRQAETQCQSADGAVTARLPESYQWLLVPEQETPQSQITWEAYRLTGADALAVRAARKLVNDDLLVPTLAGTTLRMHLDRVPLWRGDSVSIKQLAEDFARYPYLPRLASTDVLLDGVRKGLRSLVWQHDSYAYAESYDEERGRYRGLSGGQDVPLSATNMAGLLVRPEVAQKQLREEAERATRAVVPPAPPAGGGDGQSADGPTPGTVDRGEAPGVGAPPAPERAPRAPRRYHGTVRLDSARVGRDAGRIAEEVITHLAGLVGARVQVTLEIEAEVPDGVPEHVVRVVLENGRTLGFAGQGFEEE